MGSPSPHAPHELRQQAILSAYSVWTVSTETSPRFQAAVTPLPRPALRAEGSASPPSEASRSPPARAMVPLGVLQPGGPPRRGPQATPDPTHSMARKEHAAQLP